MATYREIQKWIEHNFRYVPKTCWIADVMAEHGLTRRTASNRIDPSAPSNPCPARHRATTTAALVHFEMVRQVGLDPSGRPTHQPTPTVRPD
jgi:hypothetical protein